MYRPLYVQIRRKSRWLLGEFQRNLLSGREGSDGDVVAGREEIDTNLVLVGEEALVSCKRVDGDVLHIVCKRT